MNGPVSTGKSLSILVNLLSSAMRLTPTNSSRILGVVLVVSSVIWLGENVVAQLDKNNEQLLITIEDQTSAIIVAFKQNAKDNGVHAKNMQKIFDGISGSNRDLDYLKGRMENLESRVAPYKSARYEQEDK